MGCGDRSGALGGTAGYPTAFCGAVPCEHIPEEVCLSVGEGAGVRVVSEVFLWGCPTA